MPVLPDGHFWSEYVRTDDPFWTGIRRSLVGFFAINPQGSPAFLGTGFIIAAAEEFLLALTAKHVVVDGAIQIQAPNQRRTAVAEMLFEPVQPSIEPKALRAVWTGPGYSDVLLVRHVNYTNKLDFALCVLEWRSETLSHNKPDTNVVALDTHVPSVGEWVHVVALTDFVFEGTSPNLDGAGIWRVGTRPVVRVGRVLSHESGALGHGGLCFRTTVPVDSGMSGGFAYVPREGQAVAASGIVSSGPQADDKQKSFLSCGNSAFGAILGTLGLQLPQELRGGQSTMLLDLLKSGEISDVSGGAPDIEIANIRVDGSHQIVKRSRP